jgi:hypothetical protein
MFDSPNFNKLKTSDGSQKDDGFTARLNHRAGTNGRARLRRFKTCCESS